ncbi:hypothetical protein KIH74_29130 [Kineosporia sp. J2-2]|uniref:Uncharacterized protein n=1 Tax=Kineosporia corallincola TaxID=2835133 RepID=A0ABS5TPK6_9ACTN|nr:PPC domain-containing protein [Kineosporia corallincola]MBT0773042.1 hypothetical protein [Kineosporia corallincola]
MKKPGLRIATLIAAPLVLAMMVLGAQTASAAEVKGGKLTEGVGTKAEIKTKDTTLAYTFAVTKGRHVTLSTSGGRWTNDSGALWKLYTPGGEWADWWFVNKDPHVYEFTPNATGDWKLVLAPLDNATGWSMITYASDVVAGPLKANESATVENTVRGQNMVVKFGATKDQHISLDVTATKFKDGKAIGRLYAPDGTLVENFDVADKPTFYDFSPLVTGEWWLTIDPQDFAKGKATVNLVPDLAPVALKDDTAVTTTIKSRGQNASYTFSATAGTKVPFSVTKSDWGKDGSAHLYFYRPDGVFIDHCVLGSKPATCAVYPTASGTWKISLDPQGAATGSVTISKGKAVAPTAQ